MIDMAPSLALLVLIAVLVGTGVVLILERSLSRIVIGVSLTTYGINLLVLMAGGRAGSPPLITLPIITMATIRTTASQKSMVQTPPAPSRSISCRSRFGGKISGEDRRSRG